MGSALSGNLKIYLRNTGGQTLKATIHDNFYKTGTVTRTISPGHETSIVRHLKQSHGWYDFTVKSADSEPEARFAGRVETGKTSFTDPFMGGVF
jgi:phospholipase C